MDIEARAVDPTAPWAIEHIRQYLATDGGRVDHPHADVLILLYTTGRTSGKIRRVPVVHVPDGDDLLVVASKGGAPVHPEWYHNLVADPRVWVRRKAQFFAAVATTLDAEARAAVWARIVAAVPMFGEYEARTERQIPVVRIAPAG